MSCAGPSVALTGAGPWADPSTPGHLELSSSGTPGYRAEVLWDTHHNAEGRGPALVLRKGPRVHTARSIPVLVLRMSFESSGPMGPLPGHPLRARPGQQAPLWQGAYAILKLTAQPESACWEHQAQLSLQGTQGYGLFVGPHVLTALYGACPSSTSHLQAAVDI